MSGVSGDLARWDNKLIWALPETACSVNNENTPSPPLFMILDFHRIEDHQTVLQGHCDASVTGSRRHH